VVSTSHVLHVSIRISTASWVSSSVTDYYVNIPDCTRHYKNETNLLSATRSRTQLSSMINAMFLVANKPRDNEVGPILSFIVCHLCNCPRFCTSRLMVGVISRVGEEVGDRARRAATGDYMYRHQLMSYPNL